MCTLGAVQGRFLFKNRDMGLDNGLEETIFRGAGRYRYIGVAGHATPKERGLNSGINEAGVAAAITYVGAETLAQALETKVPRGTLIEDVLRSAKDIREALQIATEHLNRDAYVGGNLVIATREAVASIEELPPRYAVEVVHAPWFVRTNHFVNLNLPPEFLPREANSRVRYQRFSELLAESEKKEFGPEDIRRALGDHKNGKDSICRHGVDQAVTVSSVAYDLRGNTMYYLYGLPCSREFTRYGVDF